MVKKTLLSVDFCPAVLESARAVEDKVAVIAVGVGAEIAEALELESVGSCHTVLRHVALNVVGKAGFHLATLQNLQ